MWYKFDFDKVIYFLKKLSDISRLFGYYIMPALLLGVIEIQLICFLIIHNSEISAFLLHGIRD